MYQKLLIDKKLECKITKDLEKVFSNNNINYTFSEGADSFQYNVLYLTADKNNIKPELANVFLMSNDYDFLDVKDAIFIRRIEDVVRVYMEGIWKSWAKELQFLAQCSLAYSKDKFDRERSERIREISCEMLAYKYDISPEKIKEHFASEIGYQTPKVETRAAIIKDNKILLVKEQLDVIKEAKEEAGAIIKPKKIIAVLDYNRHHPVSFPLGMVKIFVLCEYIDHDFEANTETLAADFFSLDNLPELSVQRTTRKQLEMCFSCSENPDDWETIFD